MGDARGVLIDPASPLSLLLLVVAFLWQVRRLGAGTYGTTFLEREPETGELVAVKYLRREDVRALRACELACSGFLHSLCADAGRTRR